MSDLTSPEFQSMLPPGSLPLGEPGTLGGAVLPGGVRVGGVRGGSVTGGTPGAGAYLADGGVGDAGTLRVQGGEVGGSGVADTLRLYGGGPGTVGGVTDTGAFRGPGPVYAPPSPFGAPLAGPLLTGTGGGGGLGPVFAPPSPFGAPMGGVSLTGFGGDRGLGPVYSPPFPPSSGFGVGAAGLTAITGAGDRGLGPVFHVAVVQDAADALGAEQQFELLVHTVFRSLVHWVETTFTQDWVDAWLDDPLATGDAGAVVDAIDAVIINLQWLIERLEDQWNGHSTEPTRFMSFWFNPETGDWTDTGLLPIDEFAPFLYRFEPLRRLIERLNRKIERLRTMRAHYARRRVY